MRRTISLMLLSASCAGQSVSTAYPALGVPLPDKPQIVMQEISCHVQQEQRKNKDGTTTNVWQPWLRVQRQDSSVWSQKGQRAESQSLAVAQCQAWVEIASRLRETQRIHTENSARISEIEVQHREHLTTTNQHDIRLKQHEDQIQSLKDQIQKQGAQIETLRTIIGKLPQQEQDHMKHGNIP